MSGKERKEPIGWTRAEIEFSDGEKIATRFPYFFVHSYLDYWEVHISPIYQGHRREISKLVIFFGETAYTMSTILPTLRIPMQQGTIDSKYPRGER